MAEYTNATHTQLLGVKAAIGVRKFSLQLDLDLKAASPLVPPGTDVGQVEGGLHGCTLSAILG